MRPYPIVTAFLAALPLGLVTSPALALTSSLPAGATNVKVVASVTDGDCVIRAGTAELAVADGPAQYVAFAERSALNVLCRGALGYQVVSPASYTVPDVALAEAAGGEIAVAFDARTLASPAAPVVVTALRLNPTTLATLATGYLQVPPPPVVPTNPPAPSIFVSSIEFTVPGDLLVFGTKDGSFPSSVELTSAGGVDYQATFSGFATGTGTQGVSQILSW